MQGYTTFKLEIPNDRTDYIEIVKTISKSLKNSQKKEKLKQTHKKRSILEYAGAFNDCFNDNISSKQIRKNRADKIWKKFILTQILWWIF